MMPALLISTSALSIPSANCRTDDRSCRSSRRTSTWPVICRAAASPFSVLRTAMTILAPFAANSRAVTAPSPLFAPVMITVRPANDGRSAAVQSVMPDNGSDVERQRQRGGSGDSGDGFPRRGAGSTGVGHTLREDPERLGQLEPREMSAEAVMDAAAEGEHGRCAFSGDVQTLRVVVDFRVAVGRGGVGEHKGAGGDVDPGQLDVLGGSADGAENDWGITH